MNISKDNKRKIIGAGAALLFHLLIVIVLLAFGLPYQDPPPKEIGVEMSADDLTEAEDDGMAGQTGGGETTDDPAVSSNNDDSPSITQNSEQVPLAAKPAKEKPKVQPKEAKPEVDETALFSKGKVKKTGSGQGTGTGNGMSEGQGSGQGQKGEGAGESGISYSLSGRGSKSLSAPKTNTTKTGKVVIEIKVDQQGNVIEAHADPLHSSIFDTNIWRTCEQAAKRSKFTAKENAPEIQRGTITYKLQH
ncbi:MAG: hypothetical protein J6M30_00320 [Bacteroidales bacterium]|nr:hypothetical protein [Bacteroidales bacterium]